jgi:hypothetical protein
MENIYFQKIQISGPAMNFVLEPQNFSGKNWNSPINIGPASLFRAITYNVNSFSAICASDATLSGSSATEIQFQGSNDGVNWTVLYSTTTTGSVAEVLTSISSNLTTGHRHFELNKSAQPEKSRQFASGFASELLETRPYEAGWQDLFSPENTRFSALNTTRPN